jgi:hypothetical protein
VNASNHFCSIFLLKDQCAWSLSKNDTHNRREANLFLHVDPWRERLTMKVCEGAASLLLLLDLLQAFATCGEKIDSRIAFQSFRLANDNY